MSIHKKLYDIIIGFESIILLFWAVLGLKQLTMMKNISSSFALGIQI